MLERSDRAERADRADRPGDLADDDHRRRPGDEPGRTVDRHPGATTASSAPPTDPATTPPAPVVALTGDEVEITEFAAIAAPIALTWRDTEPEAIYLAEQTGRIHRLDRATGEGEVVLDIDDDTSGSGERGLLGIAFDPDGEQLYVSYTNNSGDTRIDTFGVVEDGTVDTESRREVFAQDQPYGNHNGGNIVFGPDGYLYLGLGDGGAGGDPERRSLDMSTLLGKLVRIDPSTPSGDLGYSVPADNPFVGDGDARPEIWSSGLRNPWRFSFDRATGDLWIGDVGQGTVEEVDLATAADGAGRGVSFGWSAFEGSDRYNDDQPAEGHQGPLTEYTHGGGECSVTGGFVYRGTEIPALAGAYVYGDYCSGEIWALQRLDDGTLHQVTLATVVSLSSFGEDAQGELYAMSLGGALYRFNPAG